MIAQIIPRIKLPRKFTYFDYAIPLNLVKNIKIGHLVKINFRGKELEGLVYKLKEKTYSTKKLKNISAVIEELSPLPPPRIKLLTSLADYYFISWGLMLKNFIPAIPKNKKIKTTALNERLKNFYYPPAPQPRLRNYSLGKSTLFQYALLEDKLNFYYSIIRQNIKRNKTTLVVAPGLAEVARLFHFFSKHFDEKKIALFLSDLPKGAYFKEWSAVLERKKLLILGNRNAIFAPLDKNSLIIIDEENREEHKQREPNPRYQTKKVASLIQLNHGNKIVLSARAPRLETYYRSEKKELSLLKSKLPAPLPAKIIDINEEIRAGNYSFISDFLEEKIKKTAADKKQTVLFLNRRGLGRVLACKDCRFIFKCDHCQLPMVHHLFEGHWLYCHHCDKKSPLSLTCPNCRGSNIKSLGRGTQSVEMELKKKYPDLKILRLDKDADLPNLNQDKLSEADIIIGTALMWPYLRWSKIGLIAALSLDTLLNIPDFRATEKTFQFIYQTLLNCAAQKKIPLFIAQTYAPQNPIIKYALALDYESFYQYELKERKIFNYPPFSQIIKLIYQDENNKKCQKETDKIFAELKEKNKKLAAALTISPPLPSYRVKIRNKYRWHIIIRSPQENFKTIHALLRTLPEDWLIDISPENLR